MTYEFDPKKAARKREEAIRRVDEHAEEQWKMDALHAVKMVARQRKHFTTDAVWKVLEGITDFEPAEPRAMGAVMRRAVKAGFCVITTETRESIRTSCNRRPLRIWESLIHGQGPGNTPDPSFSSDDYRRATGGE